MFITFSDGRRSEARIYMAAESTIRVAVSGEADLRDFSSIKGEWVSEDCEPVQVEYEWDRNEAAVVPRIEDCICAPELASKLIECLHSDSDQTEQPEHVLAAS